MAFRQRMYIPNDRINANDRPNIESPPPRANAGFATVNTKCKIIKVRTQLKMSATGASTFLSERMNRRYFILLFVVAGGGSLQNVLGMVRKKLLSCFVLQFNRISFGT